MPFQHNKSNASIGLLDNFTLNIKTRSLMKKNVIRQRSYQFAVRSIELYKHLGSTKREYVIAKQILRSGTSIGAMVREAQNAESKKDFIHKLSIAQKDANESLYWIELLADTNYITRKEFDSLHTDGRELMKLLTAILLSLKKEEGSNN